MKKERKKWFPEDDEILNRSLVKKILLLAFLIIAMFVALNHLGTVYGWLKKLWDIVFPFVLGGCIAFLFNVPLRQIETKILRKPFRGRRAVSYLMTLILIVGIIAAALFVIVPKVIETGKTIASDFQSMGSLQTMSDTLAAKFPQLKPVLNRVDLSYSALIKYVTNFFSGAYTSGSGSLVSSAAGVVSSVVSGVASFLIGFAFSIYVLFRKEALGRQIRKILYALFPERFSNRFLEVAALSDKTFSNFIRGQVLEACILGMMFFLTLTVCRMPYALLIAVLIAITALIPIFGAFIGAAVSFLLILIVSPKQAFLFLIIFVVLQQIEGKLIYPHVVGGSVGLPSIWVLFAITVGGELMGVAGMIIFVPLCSVLYALFREFIHDRLKQRKIPADRYMVPYRTRIAADSGAVRNAEADSAATSPEELPEEPQENLSGEPSENPSEESAPEERTQSDSRKNNSRKSGNKKYDSTKKEE